MPNARFFVLITMAVAISAPLVQAEASLPPVTGGGQTLTPSKQTITGDRTTSVFDPATATLPSGLTTGPGTSTGSSTPLPQFPLADEEAPPWVLIAVAARVVNNESIPIWIPNAVLDPAKKVAAALLPNVTLPNDALPYWFLIALAQHLAEPGASIPKWVPNDIYAQAIEPAVAARPEIGGDQSLSALAPACTGAGPASVGGGGSTTGSSSSMTPSSAPSGAAATIKDTASWTITLVALVVVIVAL